MSRMGTHEQWIERDAAVVWHGFTQMSVYGDNTPVVVERAEGREVIDPDGNRYFDAISSLWVTTLGHRVPELDEALKAQVDRVAHSTMLGNGGTAAIELAEALVPRLPVDRAHLLFSSDGAAAVEQALRIAFQHWTNLGVEGRTTYLALGGAYHGDTIGSLSVGAGGFGTEVLDPLRFPVLRAPGLDDPAWAAAACALVAEHADRLAAVIVEPLVQGAAGIQVGAPEDFARLAAACREHDVLLIADEVATGFGRTGTLFAGEQVEAWQPDLMCVGKGITGGYLAMAATAASQRVYEAFLGPDLSEKTLYHGHSYGGNALAAAVALRHLQLVDEWDVLANVRARSAQLDSALEAQVAKLDQVREVRIKGLMSAVELASPADDPLWARRTCSAMVRRGVLARSLGDSVVLVPPLTTTEDEVDRIVATLAEAIPEGCATP
jgi:adenosylmethionine-8-amino-7-oxononanoate aminotransferase